MVEEIQVLQEAEEVAEGPSGPNVRLLSIGCGGGTVLVVILALVALFLPPLNLAATLRGCQALDANHPSVLSDSGISAVWTGPDSLRACLGSIPLDEFLSGQNGGDLQGAAAAIPFFLQMQSPLYTIEKLGDGQAVLEIVLPAAAQPYETLDLYSWDPQTRQWVFVPGHVDASAGVIRTDELPRYVAVFQTSPITPQIGTTLEANHVLDPTTASTLNLVMPTGLTLQSDGSLAGALIGGWGLGQGYAVVPVIRAADANGLSLLLNNQASLALHVDDIKTFVVGDGYDGIAIDYSNVAPLDRDLFSQFIRDLVAALHPYNKLVVVVLPQPTALGDGTWDTGAYDWRAIGTAADAVVITAGNNPADYTVGGSAMSMLGWAVGEISRIKIYLASSSYSVEDTNGSLQLISYDEALMPLGTIQTTTAPPEGRNTYDPGSQITFNLNGGIADFAPDQSTGAYTYSFSDANGQHRVWVITANTVRARLDMANNLHIGGMVINDLTGDGNDSGLLTAINEFKVSSTSTVPGQIVLNWTVTGASGAVLTQTTGIGTPLVWQAAEVGNYVVEGQIAGGRVSDRGSVNVQVAPPPTTPPPTARPTLPPSSGGGGTPKPTPAPTTPPPPPPAPAGGAGSDGGATELGGQVPGGIGYAAQMQQAGMKWVKFQAPFGSVDVGTAASYVAQGHAAGFKVLLSIPGPHYPSAIDFAGAVEFMRQVAANAKPDAIEVWNEMNIHNEWPDNQIDPNSYVTNMLAPAFNAIKAASPGTMVIIGALAPTGCDNGTTCWSDQRYAQGLAAAGAANYANCMGVHHNSGTTSPSATTGHPYDSGDHHYSWYFLPTINVTYNAMGRALPMCLTEFGYLSAEGYGPLSSDFAWAASTTAAQQAAWLAEGYQIAKGLGYMRLVIVWNVGYTYWGPTTDPVHGDPQAGYSIIRPGGGCPACDALHAVTP